MFRFLWLIVLFPSFTSCVNVRRATYFNDIGDSAEFSALSIPEPVIQPKDVLSITINSQNREASEIFNLPNETRVRSTTPTGDVLEPAGYVVDGGGFISFLMLGNIQAGGLTKKQLAENLRSALVQQRLLMDPVVQIRHLNFKITILGEVLRPTVITVPNERITLPDVLGLAGDITINAKRNNVMIIRDVDGRRVVRRIDLTSSELFRSEFYYLKSNDVIYVAPNKARVTGASRFNQLAPVLISTLSFGIIVFDRLVQ